MLQAISPGVSFKYIIHYTWQTFRFAFILCYAIIGAIEFRSRWLLIRNIIHVRLRNKMSLYYHLISRTHSHGILHLTNLMYIPSSIAFAYT